MVHGRAPWSGTAIARFHVEVTVGPEQPIDVLVVGGANFDYLIKAPDLPAAGESIAGGVLHEGPGGKGANQAVAASRLGARAAFVGCVGADARGRAILAELAREHVDTRCVRSDVGAITGVALIMVNGRGEKAIMTAPGANRRLSVDDVAYAAPWFARARVVLLQLEPAIEVTLAAARRGREHDARVVLDMAPPAALPDALVRAAHVVRGNSHEARVVTGIDVTDVDSARRAGQALRRRGAAAVCIAAPGGDLLLFGTRELWLPHQPVEIVDATGAGDAFSAGIAVGLAENLPLDEAARLGASAAAVKTTRMGAQAGLPRRDEVDRALALVERERT